jgi:Fanconi anemia group M protein
MEKIVKNYSLEEKWKKLPFSDFKNHENKLIFWKYYALKSLEFLPQNIGLMGNTGSGKIIIAILMALNFKKVILLAPTKILTVQHCELYKKITGNENSVHFNGEIAKREEWNNSNYNFITSTPQTFLRDYKNGKVNLDKIDLVFFDELDTTNSKYIYVELAKILKQKNISLIGLLAFSSGNEKGLLNKKNVYNFKNFLYLDIPTPQKEYCIVKISLDEVLKKSEKILDDILVNIVSRIDKRIPLLEIFLENNRYLSESNLKILKKRINSFYGKRKYYNLQSLLAYYRKISYAKKILISESYETFLDYVEKIKKEANYSLNNKIGINLASLSIVENNKFRKLSNYIYHKQRRQLHPKEKALLRELNNNKEQQGIIFVNNKKTAVFLEKLLFKKGFKVGLLFGGPSRSKKKLKKNLDLFLEKKIQFLLTTSVVEKGLSVPGVELVIHYNSPITEISMLQRDEKAGRFSPGKVVYLIIENYEEVLFSIIFSKFKHMKKVLKKDFSSLVSFKINEQLKLDF